MLTRRNLLKATAALTALVAVPALAKTLPEPTPPGVPFFPAGTVVPFAGDPLPLGWLPCDGRTLTPEAYPELFRAIGMSFGGDINRRTFKLPLRRVFSYYANGMRFVQQDIIATGRPIPLLETPTFEDRTWTARPCTVGKTVISYPAD